MIYLDNSATTNPKPKSVVSRANNAMVNYSYNSGRGGYNASVSTAGKIFECREKLSDMFGFNPQNIVFTSNCTMALNMAIKGSVKRGDHVIISSLEHNAVYRPISALALDGIITYDVAPFDYDSEKLIKNFESLINEKTTLIVCMHASNVFGCVFPIDEISKMCKKYGLRFIVDAAQSAGVLEIDSKKDGIDVLCAPGHKGLYGPMGTGFMAVGDGVSMSTIIEGGTGSASMNMLQPDFLPDRFESGTLNNSGIIGLGAGVDFVKSKGISSIYDHEFSLSNMLYDNLSKMNNVQLYTPPPVKGHTAPILSFNYDDYSSEKTAQLLADKGVALRAGLHCAPLAHRHFNTQNRGTVRISPSVFTTYRECEIFINYLKKL
ncbi:MAG: aminotransferase class V-fold PLP-dependent enzyme [Clostridiales bacterium]|nr:aminotransferase class V-fold PLP-dependent enzyme [Clostridiales bacterium]